MPVSICTQKEYLIESKLNRFFFFGGGGGGGVVTLELSVLLLPWFTHGGLYLLEHNTGWATLVFFDLGDDLAATSSIAMSVPVRK